MMMKMIDVDFFLPYQQVTKYLMISFVQLVLFHRIFVFLMIIHLKYSKKKDFFYKYEIKIIYNEINLLLIVAVMIVMVVVVVVVVVADVDVEEQ